MTNNIKTSSLGYPRIGKNREWKKTLEAYWSGKINEETFRAEMAGIQLQHLKTQQQAGIALIPVNDFTFMTMCWIPLLCLALFLRVMPTMAETFRSICTSPWRAAIRPPLPAR